MFPQIDNRTPYPLIMSGKRGSKETTSDRIIRMPELCQILGISKATVWARLNPMNTRCDPDFPPKIAIHSNPSGRGAVGFRLSDVEKYLSILASRHASKATTEK
jgi:predicted DNA-binding transcriptional regulator AlpA